MRMVRPAKRDGQKGGAPQYCGTLTLDVGVPPTCDVGAGGSLTSEKLKCDAIADLRGVYTTQWRMENDPLKPKKRPV